ncbi:MAG TPA: C25 family cysteine peptidase, partial [Pirellulales bacterium]|nr:C25 family cysteine peptidase [Pirellulales bacterium]
MLAYLLTALLAGAAPAAAADTVVVCPEEFRSALEPWLAYRRGQGHRVAVVNNFGSAEEVRARIHQASDPATLRWVVLVGDARRHVPTFHPRARVNVQYGSEPTIASDHDYGDLDRDGAPDVAVGRLPAATAADLSIIVAKILAYEQSLDFDLWRRQIHFVAGVGGFGTLTDLALEAATKTILCQQIPAGYATTMTYASWRSPYCPAPSRFCQTALDRLNEGSLAWVYLGHAQPRELGVVQVPHGDHRILGADDADALHAERTPPIALFLACYAAAYDATNRCLAEEFLRSPRGPVAVVGGSRVTMPYAMAVLGTQLLDQWLVQRRGTLGEVVLHAKRGMLLGARDGLQARALDSVARAINPAQTDLADERAEHVLLFNLLGDPLLRIAHAEAAAVSANDRVAPGETLAVDVRSPIAHGEATVELVVRRDRLAFHPAPRTEYVVSESAQATYQ